MSLFIYVLSFSIIIVSVFFVAAWRTKRLHIFIMPNLLWLSALNKAIDNAVEAKIHNTPRIIGFIDTQEQDSKNYSYYNFDK